MDKFKKKFLYYLFLFLFFFSFIYFCFPANSVLAGLEIDYPVLNTGSKIDNETTVPEYLKYVFDFLMFAGFFAVFLSMSISGILYFLSPAIPNAQSIARDRILGATSGLLILVTAYLIITTINPGLSFFKTPVLHNAPEFPPTPPEPGVLFYKEADCPDPQPLLRSGSLPDLQAQNLNKRIRSAKIIQGGDRGIYFISILYEDPNFRGKCFYVNPNIGCQSPNNNITPPFASSAFIHRYSTNPSGSVTFFRNADFKKDGGYLTITSSDVINKGGIYLNNFERLKFIDSSGQCTVPIEKQDCLLWSETLCPDCVIIDGKYCARTQCPSLAGENLGSVKIEGNYIILFIYYDQEKDPSKGTWSFCQSFPTKDDINDTGPQQIRWEDIKNNNLYKIPNWFAIIPIEK